MHTHPCGRTHHHQSLIADHCRFSAAAAVWRSLQCGIRLTEYSIFSAWSFYVCMCVPKNPPEVRLRLLLIRRHRLRLRRTSPRPSGFSRRHLIAKPFATGRRCPQVVATRPSQSVSRTLCCETILSPRVRCLLCVWSRRHLFGHLVPVLLKHVP